MIALPVLSATPEAMAPLVTRGPRYTSYPPAPSFHREFTDAHADALLLQARERAKAEGISLYLHVPYCSRLCWYCGCNVKVTSKRSLAAPYVDTLIAELDIYVDRLGTVPLAELSIGGGSPNFLPPAELERLSRAVFERFAPMENAQLGIELDPRDTTLDQVATLARLGYTRLSVGVQDFAPSVQAAINRRQSASATRRLIEEARALGFRSVGIDLVYGLPGQSKGTIDDTLQAVIDMRPDRLALFGYAHLPEKLVHQRLVERVPIPDVADRTELFSEAVSMLTSAGYQRVGFDHFALPEDALALATREGRLHRNFQGFTVRRGGLLIACGATAISDLGDAYWQNSSNIDDWKARVAEGHLPVVRGRMLSEDDRIRRAAIFDLMCRGKIEWRDLGDRYRVDAKSYFAHERELLAEATELVEIDEAGVALRPLGRELVRNVCMLFDAYRPPGEPSGSLTL